MDVSAAMVCLQQMSFRQTAWTKRKQWFPGQTYSGLSAEDYTRTENTDNVNQ